jgi:multiple sugar transport system permease protein
MVKRSLGYLFIAPAIIFLCVVTVYPLLDTVKTSLTEINPRERTEEFVGLQNYRDLFDDEILHNSVKNTIKFTFASVVLHIVIGGTLALLLNEQWAGMTLRNFLRGVLILPWLFSTAASALVWGLLYHTFGIMNYVFQTTGITSTTVEFLGDRDIALYSLVLVNVWKTFPFYMVLLLGGLQSIPSELYEAGVVDGANRLQRFRYITIPLLRPVILATSTIDIITTAGHFDLVKLMTRGGPIRSTETVAYYVWQTGFRDVNFGYGAAISIAMVIVLSIGVLIYLRVFTAKEQIYGDTTTTI